MNNPEKTSRPGETSSPISRRALLTGLTGIGAAAFIAACDSPATRTCVQKILDETEEGRARIPDAGTLTEEDLSRAEAKCACEGQAAETDGGLTAFRIESGTYNLTGNLLRVRAKVDFAACNAPVRLWVDGTVGSYSEDTGNTFTKVRLEPEIEIFEPGEVSIDVSLPSEFATIVSCSIAGETADGKQFSTPPLEKDQ